MAVNMAAVKGTASMWALSSDKRTVRLTIPMMAGSDPLLPLRVEFDQNSLEAMLSMLVQMHFEMVRKAPAEVPRVKH